LQFVRGNRKITFIGISWALFLGAMMTGVVVTAPLSERLHSGAVGYGWLNAGWGTGAFLSALYAPALMGWFGARRSIAIAMAALAICMIAAPHSPVLALAVFFFAVMGSGRGLSSVAMNTTLMQEVPQHFMGRVQNTFYFAGTALQIVMAILVGAVAETNLVMGFLIIGVVYIFAFISAIWPVRENAALSVAAGAK
jgi:MFS family permease